MKNSFIVAAITACLFSGPYARAQTFYHYDCDDGRHFDLAFYPETKAA